MKGFANSRAVAASRFSAAALATCALAALVATDTAVAQQRPRPAQPAQPAPPAQPPAGNEPTIVQLKHEPSQTEWLKTCGKDQAQNKEICFTTRDFVTDQGQPVLAVAVYDVKGEPSRMVRILLPPGLLLKPGIRYTIDKSAPVSGEFTICFPNGCFAESSVKADVITNMKKAKELTVSVRNQVSRQVNFVVPLEGFGTAFDGPPVDPKALAEQQKKLQDQLAKQQADLRKRLEEQRGQAPGAAPAAAPAPGAAPATPPKAN
jgi:invasion protein IalB